MDKDRTVHSTHSLNVTTTDDFRRVDANHPLQAQFVYVKG